MFNTIMNLVDVQYSKKLYYFIKLQPNFDSIIVGPTKLRIPNANICLRESGVGQSGVVKYLNFGRIADSRWLPAYVICLRLCK